MFWPSSIAVFGPNAPKIKTLQNTFCDPTTVYGVSKVAAIYCFTIVSAVVLVGTVKTIYAAYYAGSAPLVVLGTVFFYGFPAKMVLVDEIVLLAIVVCLARYMWRVITICRVYTILPTREPENQTRRRLF